MAAKGTDNKQRPIIIKKIKKGGGGGHHGGAWKVAYADFVTAMMAFFLLLWLITQVPKENLKGIAEYFEPTVGLKGQVGRDEDSAAGKDSVGVQDDMANKPGIIYGAPPETGVSPQAPQANDVEIDETDNDQLRLSQTEAEAVESELEKKRFEEISEEIKKAVEENPDLREFKQNLKIDQTQEGLRIQITDLEGMSMFEVGSTKLKAETLPLLAKLSEIIQKVDNKVAVIGHTDSKQYKGLNGYTNWELSSERANASRSYLNSAGLPEKRVFRVEGRADKEHFDSDPESAKNRRISIILLKKSIAPTE